MLSSPIIADVYIRRSTIFLCVLIGMAYSFSFGLSEHADVASMFIDGLGSTVIFFIESVLLWNIFTYSLPRDATAYQSFIFYILYCVVGVVVAVGVELLLIYLFFRVEFSSFGYTLPARVVCLILLYCVYCSYYQKNKQEEDLDDESDTVQEETKPENIIERITVRVGQKIKVIPVEDLICIKAEDDYVSLVTAEGHWLKDETMKSYEAQLPPDKFVRVHRSYIVNISKISKIERYGQKQLLQLTSGECLRISANGYKVLREKLNL
jgi:DNA-binding LytR/AlgR family response regulator